MKLYQILEHTGIGVKESPIETRALIGEVYKDKKEAEDKASQLWKTNTTEEDRQSYWCPLHYSVEEVAIK